MSSFTDGWNMAEAQIRYANYIDDLMESDDNKVTTPSNPTSPVTTFDKYTADLEQVDKPMGGKGGVMGSFTDGWGMAEAQIRYAKYIDDLMESDDNKATMSSNPTSPVTTFDKYTADLEQVDKTLDDPVQHDDGHVVGAVTSSNHSKSNRNIRNNNMGNIKDFGIAWQGKVGSDSGGNVASGSFVKFDTPEHGARALAKDLINKRKRGLNTIEKILNVYAPNGRENDTERYIKSVEKLTGLKRNQVIQDSNMLSMMKAIGIHEGDNEGYFTDSIIKSGLQLAISND